jgi:hypothetical protein
MPPSTATGSDLAQLHFVRPSGYVERLPIGERIPFPAESIPFREVFPYEGELQTKVRAMVTGGGVARC